MIYNEDINAMRLALQEAFKDFSNNWRPNVLPSQFQKLALAVLADSQWNEKGHHVEMYERIREKLDEYV